MVTIGMSELRRTCRITTTRSLSPLAHAVRTKSCLSTSSIMVRVNRISTPDSASPSTTAGMMNSARLATGSPKNGT